MVYCLGSRSGVSIAPRSNQALAADGAREAQSNESRPRHELGPGTARPLSPQRCPPLKREPLACPRLIPRPGASYHSGRRSQ